MGKIKAAKVFDAVTLEMKNSVIARMQIPKPPWYEIMASTPPSETLTRPLPTQLNAPNRKATKPKNIYKPHRLSYPEDNLRRTFYKDHPWELARPRVILESDGKDYQHVDWSKGLRQTGVKLSGESVVQRQLWLMENAGMKKQQAYDTVRREFYRLRQEEEIERRVAVEEARHTGGYFGLTRMDVGMQLENRAYEDWKAWAAKQQPAPEVVESNDETSDPLLAGDQATSPEQMLGAAARR